MLKQKHTKYYGQQRDDEVRYIYTLLYWYTEHTFVFVYTHTIYSLCMAMWVTPLALPCEHFSLSIKCIWRVASCYRGALLCYIDIKVTLFWCKLFVDGYFFYIIFIWFLVASASDLPICMCIMYIVCSSEHCAANNVYTQSLILMLLFEGIQRRNVNDNKNLFFFLYIFCCHSSIIHG